MSVADDSGPPITSPTDLNGSLYVEDAFFDSRRSCSLISLKASSLPTVIQSDPRENEKGLALRRTLLTAPSGGVIVDRAGRPIKLLALTYQC